MNPIHQFINRVALGGSGPGITISSHRLLRFLLLAWFIASSLFVQGTNNISQYSSRLWQVEDGLPHNSVRTLVQTRDGYLWAGTQEGLVRFDGVRFLPVEHPELARTLITGLCETQDGSLWIGTENGLFRLSNGTLSRYTVAEGLTSNAVRMLQEDGEGSLWIASAKGLARWRKGTIDQPFAAELKGYSLWSFCAEDDGTIWVTGPRLQRLKDQTVQTFTTENGLLGGGLRKISAGKDGFLWIATTDGLSRMKDGTFTNYPKGSAAAIVSTVLESGDGTIWVGTYAGLGRLVNGNFVSESNEENAAYWVHSMMEDREGNLWVGSDEGLSRFTPKRFLTYTRQHGLANNMVRSICAGRDGSIWIGAWGGGLNRWKDGKITTSDVASGLSSAFILSLHEGYDGSLWIGMDYSKGLDRMQNGRVTHYGAREGLNAPVIAAVHEDHQGNVWIGTSAGLICFKDGKSVRYTTQDGLSHNTVNTLCEQRDGVMWIGTDRGLTRWDGKFVSDPLYFQMAILSLYEDDEGILWIGTRGNGLHRIKNGKTTAYTIDHGLPSDSIYAILDDNKNNLWLNSSRGIFHLNKQELERVAHGDSSSVAVRTYGKMDGIISSGESRNLGQPAACKGTDGRLWFRTTQGVVVTDPEVALNKNELPPPVVIERMMADKRQMQIQGFQSDVQRSGMVSTLNIEPGRGELEFHYTALSFTAPEKTRFKYKLDGLDSGWVDAGTRREAVYNRVPPGNYTFHIMACNNDGVWNPVSAKVKFSLQPHFWQTWWFLGLCGITAVGMVGGTARYATRKKLQRKLERLEQQNALANERTRIAQDMHDDLGARLTEIMFLSGISEKSTEGQPAIQSQVNKIGGAARELVQNLDSIVWAVDPKNDTLPNLVIYIHDYAELRCGAQHFPSMRRINAADAGCQDRNV